MSIFVKIVRSFAYPSYRPKTIAVSRVNRLPKCTRYVHCTSYLSAKMYMEHENQYAYTILENKGYAISLNCNTVSPALSEAQFKNLMETDWSQKSPSELFETFDKLAVYCSEHNICISNKMFDNFIDCLTDSFKFANDKELESLFYSMNKWPDPESIRTRNYIEVWVALDDVCINRMIKWSYEELLSFIALFYMLNVTRYSDFCTKSLNKCASRAKHLSPGQVVQTLFFIGITRRAPFDMHNLEIHLHNIYPQFAIDDLGIMCMGFFKSKTPIRDMDLILKIINTVIENAKSIHEVSLAALLKQIRYSTKLTTDDRINRLLATLQHEVPRLSIMCNVHLAQLGTSTMNLHEGCLSKIAEHVIDSIPTMRLKDIERLVLTYGTFNFVPQTKECFFTKVVDELRNPKRKEEISKHGRSFACCLAYLGLLKIYPEDLIQKTLEEKFLVETYGKYCYNYGREILILHYTAEIYYPAANINRLSNKVLKTMANKYTDYVPSEEYKKQYNITERMVLDIMRTLKECRGGPQYVVGNHILPYHQRGGITKALFLNIFKHIDIIT